MQKIEIPTLSTQTHALIQTNIPLHDKNWFATGGPATYFSAPTNMQMSFNNRIQFANDHHCQFLCLAKVPIFLSVMMVLMDW